MLPVRTIGGTQEVLLFIKRFCELLVSEQHVRSRILSM